MELGTYKSDNLIAGDYPTVVDEIELVGPASFKRGDVVGISNNKVVKLVDSSSNDGSEVPVGIITENISLEENEKVISTIYIKGEFSVRHVNFGGNNTFKDHKNKMNNIGLILKHTVTSN